MGSVSHTPSGDGRVKLDDLGRGQSDDDKPVVLRAVVESARDQSAKLSFLNLRQGLSSILLNLIKIIFMLTYQTVKDDNAFTINWLVSFEIPQAIIGQGISRLSKATRSLHVVS